MMLKTSTQAVSFSTTRDRCEKLLWILTLLFPATLPLKHGVSSVFFLMLLVSIFMLSQSRPQMSRIANYMLAGFVILVLVSLLSLINVSDIENGRRRISKLMVFIVMMPIFMALVSVKLNLIKPLLIGACIGGFVLAGVSIYEIYLLGHARIAGPYNPIMFGSVAVIMVLTLFFQLLSIKTRKVYLVVILLSLLGALFAAIQSETRGAWLALIVCVPLGVGLSLMTKKIATKRIVSVLIVSVLAASIVGMLGKDTIAKRWDPVAQSIDNFLENRNDDGSIGLRIIMWDASIKIWHRHPLIGSGIGDFRNDYAGMIEDGEVGFPGVNSTRHSYAHSNIFDALAGSGILGLVGMMASTFLLPCIFFLMALKTPVDEYRRYAALFGLVFVTAFMIFGLTENWLAHKQLVMCFSLLLAIMASPFGSERQ